MAAPVSWHDLFEAAMAAPSVFWNDLVEAAMAAPSDSWNDLVQAARAAPSLSWMDLVQAAVTAGNLRRLKEIEAASGMDLRQPTSSRGRNLLHLAVMGACITGWMGVCKYLVEEKGFDANCTSTEGETPIFVATESNNVGVVPVLTYLLGRGGDPAAPDARGCTPLHNAAEYGHSEAIGLLLSRGIPVDPLNYHGMPLHLAAGKGHAQALKPNRVANHVSSPLLMACLAAKLECVKLLVQAGANVNFQPSPGPTMLLAAISVGSADIVNFLLKAGADPNIHDGCGKLPIMLAASQKRRELVEILLHRTNPISSMPDWSVGGIIGTVKAPSAGLAEGSIANAKSEGKEAFANGDYGYAVHCYLRASAIDPHDATILANLSLCWLKLREGERAVCCARQCRRLRPGWAKAWYREGAALSLLQKYKDAADAFVQALKLDHGNDEIKNALREMHRDGCDAGENP